VEDGARDADFWSNRHEGNESSTAETRKGSRELNRIQDFMADSFLPATAVARDTSANDARRRMAAKLDEFDEVFESASKAERSG
jgi:hypothetical protein